MARSDEECGNQSFLFLVQGQVEYIDLLEIIVRIVDTIVAVLHRVSKIDRCKDSICSFASPLRCDRIEARFILRSATPRGHWLADTPR